ncbi:alpha/beta fold hydrolase [Blattabacterium cuenoti]|uniref:alpha/beta fold hydrolase n=1 Tax=Blattabacterium cuenoti TaxID=1653831 RepID=UPI00163CD2CD|nr:alpha/beta fold hydrolase [Blattabacterium cuenoti]
MLNREKNFIIKKEEDPVIIFLHGFMGSSKIWNDVFRIFSDQYKILSIDLPGHGKSKPISSKEQVYSMEYIANMVKQVIEKENIKKIILIGHSMGGYISLALAEKNPNIFLGLCLLHSTSKPDTYEKKKKRKQSIQLAKKNYPFFISKSVNTWFNPDKIFSLQKEISFTKKIALSTDQNSVISFIEGMIIRKNRDFLLKTTKFPKLLIYGKYDLIIEKDSINEEIKMGYKTYLNEIPSGHMGHIEKPQILVEKLKIFIDAIL